MFIFLPEVPKMPGYQVAWKRGGWESRASNLVFTSPSSLKRMGKEVKLVTVINLPSNLKFEWEFEFTEYLRGTKYLFVIYRTTQIWILINWIVSNLAKYKQIFANGWKTDIKLFINYHNFGIQALFVSILFELDWIGRDRLNIAVT